MRMEEGKVDVWSYIIVHTCRHRPFTYARAYLHPPTIDEISKLMYLSAFEDMYSRHRCLLSCQ